MKVKIWLTALLCITMLASGCATATDAPPPETTTTDTATAHPNNTYVYEGAIKQFLLPEETFSEVRQGEPEFVMLHFTSAVMLSPTDPYNMDVIRSIFVQNELSVHYIIDRDGTVYCYVPENLMAGHAGKGTWKDDPRYTNRINHYSVGIEIVGIGSPRDMSPYFSADEYAKLDKRLIGFTDAQYASLKALVTDICARNDIPMDKDHVIGHNEYAPKKTDPGELFDWDRLLG